MVINISPESAELIVKSIDQRINYQNNRIADRNRTINHSEDMLKYSDKYAQHGFKVDKDSEQQCIKRNQALNDASMNEVDDLKYLRELFESVKD